ncbi:hypothetical protein Ddye_031761 [Dipteronia dyeriana]|uniref:Potassium transporter n=1 Tax=Dipteronia dyeriana TaxID=168575 RepID=A0AAD9TIY9_9ROSI|nr:hypothetical protein Ddye_031761 [Dipteronia dyeriana]
MVPRYPKMKVPQKWDPHTIRRVPKESSGAHLDSGDTLNEAKGITNKLHAANTAQVNNTSTSILALSRIQHLVNVFKVYLPLVAAVIELLINKELKVPALDMSTATVEKGSQQEVSIDIEPGKVSDCQNRDSKVVISWSIIFRLAFQSLGVVYGDLGTSPMYVFSSTFPNGVKHEDDILGVLCLIFYTITIIPLINYVFIVLHANDNGNGGTFALYSLICRYVKVGLIPNQQAEDSNVSNFNLVLPGNGRRQRRADAFKSKLENNQFAKLSLLLAALLGTSMVIGDGILTPCISVLSAVGGIKQAATSLTDDKIMWISTAIVVCLFTFQRLGTAIVGYSFAPIMCVWYILIGAIGFYNIVKIDPTVIKAMNPWYIIDYFRRNKKEAWISLGGTVLSITGSEALFAAVGHFTVRSVQVCTCTIVYPAIVLCYFGQAAVLHHHPEYVKDSFYKSLPGPLYWPMFVVAVLAAIIASQALISGAFSVIQQSLAMGCFPRVKVMHTSAKYEGQVFIPEINYLLMLACVGVTLGFKTTEKMGNAYELIYLSSVMYKFDQGGYLPLVFSAILMTVMYVWNNVYRRKYYYELKNKVSPQTLKEIAANTSLCRIPGLAMFHSELVHGVSPIFKQYVANVPALHSVLVFVSMKSLPISKVPREERFIFRRVEPKGLNIFRCVARYGYTDIQDMDGPLELVLVEKLKEFIRDYRSYQMITNGEENPEAGTVESLAEHEDIIQEEKIEESMEREIETVEKACRAGVVHLIGESEVVAAEGAGIGTRVMINYAYNFMKRNLRQYNKVYDHIPHKNMLKVVSWSIILQLAFQSMGVVYGDIGTSPLYVLSSTFPDGIKHADDILGALSLIFYTITLIPLFNYIFIVLRANDNGDGGTFALYSLICRHAKVGLIPSEQAEDCDVSNYQIELPNDSRGTRRASKLKSILENSHFAKLFLLFVTLLGTSMVIGDGILTPSISVLSAVGGIKEATSAITEDWIVWISVAVLVGLFTFQKLGTEKVGYTFAPIISVWFVLIGGIGAYNVIKFEPTMIRAVNPWYIIDYFRRNKKDAWISLGGSSCVIFSSKISGAEALFATVGHFTVRSIQISTCCVVYPAIILCYFGQASVLHQHPEYVHDAFYKSIPGPVYWPMFVVAVLAAIIASQAMISGSFSIIQQSLALGCFPRVKIMHTSAKYEGQVYIPEINYLLMLACVGITLGFRTTEKIGNAYGIAVVFVMTLTSFLLVLVMIIIWKLNILLIICYVLIIGSVELAYLSSVLYKFDQGGYLPLAFAALLMTVMFVWNNVYRKKYYYELERKISPMRLKEIALDRNVYRIPGLAIFYSELVQGIPPIFEHYANNVPALHSVLVFVSMKSLPISKVPLEERFIFRRVEPKELNVFRCVARYGYTDVQNKEEERFESMLIEKLKEFIIEDNRFLQMTTEARKNIVEADSEDLAEQQQADEDVIQEEYGEEAMAREIERVDRAWQDGVVHLLGENEVVAAEGAGILKRLTINYAFNFLKKNLRQYDKVFDHIPHKSMLKVGMTYEL